MAALLWKSSDGSSREYFRMHSRYSDGGWHYPRYSLANVVPELDQIHLGFAAALVGDPLFDRAQHRKLSSATDTLYAGMIHDTEFNAVGSALPSIYQELMLLDHRDGHFFHYTPKKLDRKTPAPALVFLHGSGGNFKVYTWLLAQIADRFGCTVIAPSFGLGNWEQPRAYESILAAIQEADKHAAIDPQQIHLMGLSNGGRGLCLAESLPSVHFRSIIFLSAVFHSHVTPEALADRLQSRDILIIAGKADDRVPLSYVYDYANGLKEAGLSVTLRTYAAEDHYLFFYQFTSVLQEIEKWLLECRSP